MSKAINILEDALISGDWEKIEAAIKNGTDINALDDDGHTLLSCAVLSNDPDNVRKIIQLGADINLKLGVNLNVLGYVALIFAQAKKNGERCSVNREIISVLIKAGADMNDAMLIGIRAGSVEFVDLLMQNGADINGKFAYGITPFALAMLGIKNELNPEILVYLAEHGADLNERFDLGDNIETTALNICITLERFDLMKILLEHGANPNMKDNRGRTPLILAFVVGSAGKEEISDLLDGGADINAQDPKGLTPLMWSILEFDKSADLMISALIRTGGLFTENGRKWAGFAYSFSALRRENQLEIVRLLIARGADVKIRNKNGMTALTYAMMNFDDEILSILKSAGTKDK